MALALTACQRPKLYQQEAYVFGTRVEIIVADAPEAASRKAVSTVLQEFDRLHRLYHAWQPSTLSTLNAALADGKPQAVSPELAELIREAQTLSQQSQGLFDPGIGRLIALWGFQSDEFVARLPDPAALDIWRTQPASIQSLHISPDNLVSSRQRNVALDFGGYLKGWALDRAATLLRAQGIQHALINIGGNVLALGSKHGHAWRVGIQHPRQPGPLATLALHDGEAIGTSGDYQRYFELAGQRYPHLLDPRTAAPVTHTQAVTIVIPAGPRAGTRSDAGSKPLFISGPEQWRQAAQTLGIQQVLRVDASGRVQLTRALRDRLEFTDRHTPLEVLE